jgi:hypothetical protein
MPKEPDQKNQLMCYGTPWIECVRDEKGKTKWLKKLTKGCCTPCNEAFTTISLSRHYPENKTKDIHFLCEKYLKNKKEIFV